MAILLAGNARTNCDSSQFIQDNVGTGILVTNGMCEEFLESGFTAVRQQYNLGQVISKNYLLDVPHK